MYLLILHVISSKLTYKVDYLACPIILKFAKLAVIASFSINGLNGILSGNILIFCFEYS